MKVFVVTVGRSYLSNLERSLQEKLLRVCAKDMQENYKKYINSYFEVKESRNDEDLAKYFFELIKSEKSLRTNSNSAEISTLEYLFEEGILNKDEDEVILLHNQDLKSVCNKIKTELEDRGFKNLKQRECDYHIRELESFTNLWKVLRHIYESRERGKEMIIVATGGYKLITSLVYIFSLIYGVKAYYHHEDTKKAYLLPSLPVNWDYVSFVLQSAELSEASSLVKEIFEAENVKDIKKHILYTDPILERFPAGDYQEILTKNLPVWQNLWIGDLIPETVEHSKSHSKRILQRFDILLSKMGRKFFERLSLTDDQKDEFLFYIYASAYLHDIGHTVLKAANYDFSELPEVIREFHNVLTVSALEDWKELLGLDELEEKDLTAIKLICLYHRKKMGLTDATHDSSNKIKEKFGEKLLQDLTGWKNVPMISNEAFTRLDKSTKKIVLQATALLKFLDELDVQADRVVDSYYMTVRLYRTKLESEHIIEKIELLNDLDRNLKDSIVKAKDSLGKLKLQSFSTAESSPLKELEGVLKKYEVYDSVYRCLHSDLGVRIPEHLKLLSRLLFKIVQFDHFRKHASIQAVVPEWNETGLTVCIYVEKNTEIAFDEGAVENCKAEITKQLELLQKDQQFLERSREYNEIRLLPFEFSDNKVQIHEGGLR